jgi:hypothetical protein
MSARGLRYQAKQEGRTTYFTGLPCKKGHISDRETETGTCIHCKRENDRLRYAQNPKMFIEQKQKYYNNNAEIIKQKRRVKYADNPDKERGLARIRSAEWRIANPDKVALQKDLKRNYKKANPHKITADMAKRRAAKKQRTPPWLTKKDFVMIESFYKLANEKTLQTGFAWHVDHIVPLQGKLVSGLHVPQNLRVIPWNENVSKGNKLLEIA